VKAKVVPEPFGAVHHDDRLRGQLQARIELADRGIVPRPDLTEKDSGDGGTIEGEIAGLDALDIDHHRDAADDGRELHETVRIQVPDAQRHVRGPEGHLSALDPPDAVARADRLIAHGNAGLFLVGLGPFRIDRIGERGAGARNVGADGRRNRNDGNQAGGSDDAGHLHLQPRYSLRGCPPLPRVFSLL
jgi:hypothetical protein